MDENNEMFLEEIKCCETDDDIQSFVESFELQFFDLKEHQNEKERLAIAKQQIFYLIKVLRNILQINDFRDGCHEFKQLKEYNKKLEKDVEALLNESSELHLEMNSQKLKLNQTEKKLSYAFQEIQKFNGDLNILSTLGIEELNELEVKIVKCQKSISQQKNVLLKLSEQKKIENKLCTICMSKPYSILIKPCGHVCVCEDCIKQITKCPIDRNAIIRTEKVFLS